MKKEKTGKFSYSGYTPEENKEIDILINNAGFGVFGEFTKTDLKKELNLIKITDIIVFLFLQYLIPYVPI